MIPHTDVDILTQAGSASRPRQGQTLTLLPVVEPNWSTWVRLHPDNASSPTEHTVCTPVIPTAATAPTTRC